MLGVLATLLTSFNSASAQETVYTVKEAVAMVENNQIPDTPVTVAGHIAKIDEINLAYHNATYWIVDDMSDPYGLQIYRGYWLDGAHFTSNDQFKVGDYVKVNGKLDSYQGTAELYTGSKIIEHKALDYNIPSTTVKEAVVMIREGKVPLAPTFSISAYVATFNYREDTHDTSVKQYFIIDEMTDTVSLYTYGKGLNGVDFDLMTPAVKPGDRVTVVGDLYQAGSTIGMRNSEMTEFTSMNYQLPEYTVEQVCTMARAKTCPASAMLISGYVARVNYMGLEKYGYSDYHLTTNLEDALPNGNILYIFGGYGLDGLSLFDVDVEDLVNVGDKVTIQGAVDYMENNGYQIGTGSKVVKLEHTDFIPKEYTISELKEMVNNNTRPVAEVQTVGYIVSREEINEANGYVTYVIAETPDGDNPLTVYNGYGKNRRLVKSTDQVPVGMKVKVQGAIMNSDDPYRFQAGSMIVEYDPAGVDSIAGNDANAPVEYFNLQGIRISTPEPGTLCIRRQGSKSEKIIVR